MDTAAVNRWAKELTRTNLTITVELTTKANLNHPPRAKGMPHRADMTMVWPTLR